MVETKINIGHTPLVRLKRIEELYHLPFELYGKDESKNPTGSIKDRAAYYMIKNALDNGSINENSIIVEATSGNMGISIAYICSLYHLRCVLFMPISASKERREMMSQYGAELVLVDGGMSQCVDASLKFQQEHPEAYILDQFNNPFNPKAHEETTSQEIIESLGCTPDYFLAGFGTAGTLIGNARAFKRSGTCTIIGVEPLNSPLVTKGEAHPHLIQGIGANFIPGIFDRSFVDEVITVSGEDAYKGTKLLYKEENLFMGISSGAALMSLLNYKDNIKENSKVVIILPDSGNRYRSIDGLYE